MLSRTKTTPPAKLGVLVVEFFRQNPDEFLTTVDVAIKFAVPSSTVGVKLAQRVKAQELENDRGTYRAGPALVAPATAQRRA